MRGGSDTKVEKGTAAPKIKRPDLFPAEAGRDEQRDSSYENSRIDSGRGSELGQVQHGRF